MHKAERQCILLPSLSLSLLGNIKLFYSVCGGGLLAFPSTPTFFFCLWKKKAVAVSQRELQPKLLENGY